ncbi:kinesin-like protein KIN-14S, partial [Tanacetum coccineum]
GDCKTLLFVQISPSLADLGETVCSLRFASRARGVELGPAHKQSKETARKQTGGKQLVERKENG